MQMANDMISQAGPGGLHEHTLLLMLGDHGQTLTGDHGGGSPEELDSALVAINLAAAFHARARAGAQRSRWTGELPVVEQIDFAASLATLMGLPIPAENVGVPPSRGLQPGQSGSL